MVELILSLCDLVEAEGRLLRLNVLRVTRQCALMLAGLLFGITALAFMVAALYALLILILPPAAVFALLALVCAAICALFIRSCQKCQKTGRPKQADAMRKTSSPNSSRPK